MATKTCSKCNLVCEESSFLPQRNICKECRSSIRKAQYASKAAEAKESTEEKTCTICGESKVLSLFRIDTTYCSDCHNQKRREYVDLKKAPPPVHKKITCPEGYKLCKDCYIVKNEDEFRDKRLKCKKCENKERVAYKNGRILKQPEPTAEKEEDDFSKQLKVACRFRIRDTIPEDIAQKLTERNRFGYIYDLIGNDMNFLKRWLRFNYTAEMTDDNYGSYWFMDHVIPIHTFKIKENYEQNKKNCYSWFNITALSAVENSRKFTGINKEQLQTHLNRLLAFCTENEIQPDQNYLSLCSRHLDAGNPLEPSTTTSQ
jgi:hypothetical protein